LLVKEAVVGEGPTFKRFRARARGSASPLRKRTSHIRIVLSDDLVPKAAKPRAKRGSKTASRTEPAKKRKQTAAAAVTSTETEPTAPRKTTESAEPTEPASEAESKEEKE